MYVIKPKQVRLFFDICRFYVDSISVCHASIGWICKQNRFAVSWWLDLYVYGLSNKYGNHNVSWVHKNIPEELEEAATIDGCGSIRLFISIVLPLMRTIIVTVAVINVMGTWNDFLLPSLIINKQGLQTLPLKHICSLDNLQNVGIWLLPDWLCAWLLSLSFICLVKIHCKRYYRRGNKVR